MTETGDDPQTIHASCVEIDGIGVLIAGESGTGKSDLALRLLDRGAKLISDDYTLISRDDGHIVATAPDRIAGQIEVRNLGILVWPSVASAKVGLIVATDEIPARMPTTAERSAEIMGLPLERLALAALEPSAPLKVELTVQLLRGKLTRNE